jgi:hypothetical protein
MMLIDGLFAFTVAFLAVIFFRKALVRAFFTPEWEGMGRGIPVCISCGSRNISGLKHIKHWLKRHGPVMGIYTCQDCGWEGLPMILNSEEDYIMYRDLRKNERENRDNI